MSKLAFVILDFNLGGTEKSLLNHLSKIKDKDITIFVLEIKGKLIDAIPSNILVESIDLKYDIVNDTIFKCFKKLILRFKFWTFIKLLYYLFTKNWRQIYSQSVGANYHLKKFDYAVAYSGPHSFVSCFVLDHLKSNYKIQWIHFDLNKFYHDKKLNESLYKHFDFFFCVSLDVKNNFEINYPQISSNKPIKVKNNTINEFEILKLSNFIDLKIGKGKILFLTVARLSQEKGILEFLEFYRSLIDKYKDYYWFIIGDGPLKNSIHNRIHDLDLTNNVHLTGTLINPYPYFRACDIYIQPSKYEGFSVSILEAMFFNKAIIATNFSGVREQLDTYSVPSLVLEDLSYTSFLSFYDFITSLNYNVDKSHKIIKRDLMFFSEYLGLEN